MKYKTVCSMPLVMLLLMGTSCSSVGDVASVDSVDIQKAKVVVEENLLCTVVTGVKSVYVEGDMNISASPNPISRYIRYYGETFNLSQKHSFSVPSMKNSSVDNTPYFLCAVYIGQSPDINGGVTASGTGPSKAISITYKKEISESLTSSLSQEIGSTLGAYEVAITQSLESTLGTASGTVTGVTYSLPSNDPDALYAIYEETKTYHIITYILQPTGKVKSVTSENFGQYEYEEIYFYTDTISCTTFSLVKIA